MSRQVGFAVAAITLSVVSLGMVFTGHSLVGLPFALAACGCSGYSISLGAREYRR